MKYLLSSRSSSWHMTNRLLHSYLTSIASAPVQPGQKSLCYFLLGKIAEKRKLTKQSLSFYRLAEQQLFDHHQNDEAFLLIRLEINFRITASIYKYVCAHAQPTGDAQTVIDKEMLSFVLHVLKRDRRGTFNATEMAMRMAAAAASPPQEDANAAVVDENDNQIIRLESDGEMVSLIPMFIAFLWSLLEHQALLLKLPIALTNT